MSAGMWFLVWVGGLTLFGAMRGPATAALGAVMGFALWAIFGLTFWLWGALSVNPCVEYGYPSLSDMDQGKTCSDEEIYEHIERTK